MTSGAQANTGALAAAGASRVLFLTRLLIADLEQRLTVFPFQGWEAFEQTLASWLATFAEQFDLDDGVTLIARDWDQPPSVEERGTVEERWYDLCRLLRGDGTSEWRFLRLTAEDQEVYQAAVAMATANVYDSDSDDFFARNRRSLAQRLDALRLDDNWLAHLNT